MSTELFEDIFEVRQLNPEGKKFDKGMHTDSKPSKCSEMIRFVLE
jgi:hypothetical protein